MSKADPRTTPIRSRRAVLAGIASAAAMPIAAAVPNNAEAAADPIFAALEAFRSADAEFYADRNGDIPDAIGDRRCQAADDVIRTQPTTPAGLGALTSFARDMAERSNRGDAGFADAQWVPVMEAIDDATRGMSGLEPWSPLPTVPAENSSDEELVVAANGLLATDEAIEQMHRQHAASGATGDADEKPEYLALEEVRDVHIAALIINPATAPAGLRAKAIVLRSQRMIEDDERHQQIAVSLADDLFDLDQSTIALGAGPIAGQSPLSEALALVDLCRQGDRRWSVLYDQIERAEHSARPEYGSRPSNLIEWRNYSAIYGAEIEGARDRFIGEGIDEKVIQAEYRSAKKRFRATFRAQEDWDRKAGLNDLRKEYEANKSETQAAWKALGKVRLTNIRDAAAIIGILRERMHRFDELTDDREVAAFMNASRFITRTAA